MTMRPFLAAARLGASRAAHERASLIGQVLIMLTLQISYAAVYHALPRPVLDSLGLNPALMLWYFTVAETLLIASFLPFKQVQQDIRSGMVEIHLLRPVSYGGLFMAEAMGAYAARVVLLLVPCWGAAWFLADGVWPWDGQSLALVFPSLLMAGWIMNAGHFLVGCSTLWTGQAEPIFWLWQKCAFLLGALLWPLAFFPDWLARFAWMTPFPAMLATPAHMALPGMKHAWIGGLAHQVFWSILAFGVVMGMEGILLRRWQRQAG